MLGGVHVGFAQCEAPEDGVALVNGFAGPPEGAVPGGVQRLVGEAFGASPVAGEEGGAGHAREQRIARHGVLPGRGPPDAGVRSGAKPASSARSGARRKADGKARGFRPIFRANGGADFVQHEVEFLLFGLLLGMREPPPPPTREASTAACKNSTTD